MIPYADFQFFVIALAILSPAIYLGLHGKSLRSLIPVVSIIMLVLIFRSWPKQLFSILLYIVWQVLITLSFLKISSRKKSKGIYWSAIIFALLPLVIAKLGPVLQNGSMLGFLGLSYITFKAVQVIIEIQDGLIKEIKLIDYLSFLFFFPVLSSGPIDRYRRFNKDLSAALTADEYKALLRSGTNRLFQGLLYKFILAVLIKAYWLDHVDLQTEHWLPYLSYMYGYSLYLFFDFAGYSSFAIGLSYFLGIKTPENFRQPFISNNIKDFWNRWHISLSAWFRDYVFMRLIMDFTRQGKLKNKYLISYLGYLALFGLMGVWHGLEPQYLLYGLYHAALMIGFDLLDRFNKKRHFWQKGFWWDQIAIVVNYHFIAFGFLIFSGKLFA